MVGFGYDPHAAASEINRRFLREKEHALRVQAAAFALAAGGTAVLTGRQLAEASRCSIEIDTDPRTGDTTFTARRFDHPGNAIVDVLSGRTTYGAEPCDI